MRCRCRFCARSSKLYAQRRHRGRRKNPYNPYRRNIGRKKRKIKRKQKLAQYDSEFIEKARNLYLSNDYSVLDVAGLIGVPHCVVWDWLDDLLPRITKTKGKCPEYFFYCRCPSCQDHYKSHYRRNIGRKRRKIQKKKVSYDEETIKEARRLCFETNLSYRQIEEALGIDRKLISIWCQDLRPRRKPLTMFSDQEDTIIKENFNKMPLKQLQKLLPARSTKSIEGRAHRLGLKKRPRKIWAEQEDDLLREHQEANWSQLKKLFPDRSRASVVGRRMKLGLRQTVLSFKEQQRIARREAPKAGITTATQYERAKAWRQKFGLAAQPQYETVGGITRPQPEWQGWNYFLNTNKNRKRLSFLEQQQVARREAPKAGITRAKDYVDAKEWRNSLGLVGQPQYIYIKDKVKVRPEWRGWDYFLNV